MLDGRAEHIKRQTVLRDEQREIRSKEQYDKYDVKERMCKQVMLNEQTEGLKN